MKTLADLLLIAFGIEGEEAGEDEVALSGWPEIAALIGVVVLSIFGEKLGLDRVDEIIPAIGAEHGSIHLVVQLAQALNGRVSLALLVEAVVGLGHPFIGCDHFRKADAFLVAQGQTPVDWLGEHMEDGPAQGAAA